MIEIKTIDLTSLKSVAETINIQLDNSVNVIDEMNGPEYFYIQLDVVKNAAMPINTDETLSLLEQYTKADYAGIYETYIEWKSFEGMFCISSGDANRNWSLSFHGSEKQDETGDLKEEEKKLIAEILHPKSIYFIADEVLSSCR